MLIDLDDPAGLEPSVAGAKAAWLARARRAGLPVLPGVIVGVDAGRDAVALGAERLEAHGTGAARLAIASMPVDPALADALPGGVAALGPRLVVRSSSPLEGEAVWAGAFTSYLDVTVDMLPTAIRGCWASAFSNGSVERARHAQVPPTELRLAVLIQRAVTAETGGTARVVGDATLIVAVAGSPAPLLQGWDPGVHGRVDADGSVTGEALADLVGPDTLRALAEIVRTAQATIGATSCEWAVVDGDVVLLQLGRDQAPAPSGADAPQLAVDANGLGRLARIARTIRHAPGDLGAEMVLGWALGEAQVRQPGPRSPGSIRRTPRDSAGGPRDAASALEDALALSRALTIATWRDPGDTDDASVLERGRAAIAALRGVDPVGAAAIVAGRPAPDPALAMRLMELLDQIRDGLVRAGAAADPDEAWYLGAREAAAALSHPVGGPRARRPRLDPWQPFQVAVILATGQCRTGAPSGPGIGAGRLVVVRDARAPKSIASRDVILARRPIPHLAPLLWDATAVVTAGGGPGAHLFESARALGLPAVSGIGLDDLIVQVLSDEPGVWAVAVDGTAGVVAFTPW